MNYILDSEGTPVPEPDLLKWGRWMERRDRSVAKTSILGVEVSTVFLGMDHNWGDGPPILWETLVFGGVKDGDMERCSGIREDAQDMHRRMCSEVRIAENIEQRPLPLLRGGAETDRFGWSGMSKIPSQLGNPGHSTISINTNTMNNIPRNNNLGLQVITIKPDGSLCGLDHKKKGLDLRQFGKARIERVTLIEWDENEQGWEVFRTAPNTLSKPWGAGLARGLGVDPEKLLGRVLECKERVLFQEYEDAVEFEVALIQAMQVSGKGDQVFGK